MKCHCGRPAFVKHPASGNYLCNKHFLRYLTKKVRRNLAELGLLKCGGLKISVDERNVVEARIVKEAFDEWARRKSCRLAEFSNDGIRPLGLEWVLYYALRAFFYLDEEAWKVLRSPNPTYDLLPFEKAVYAYVKGIKRDVRIPDDPLWDVALDVATAQPSEAFSSLKSVERLKALFPVLKHGAPADPPHPEL